MRRNLTRIVNLIGRMFFVALLLSNQLAIAAPPGLPQTPGTALPSTVEPGQVSRRLSEQPQEMPKPSASYAPQPAKPAGALGPQAEKIKFTLKKNCATR